MNNKKKKTVLRDETSVVMNVGEEKESASRIKPHDFPFTGHYPWYYATGGLKVIMAGQFFFFFFFKLLFPYVKKIGNMSSLFQVSFLTLTRDKWIVRENGLDYKIFSRNQLLQTCQNAVLCDRSGKNIFI